MHTYTCSHRTHLQLKLRFKLKSNEIKSVIDFAKFTYMTRKMFTKFMDHEGEIENVIF